VWALKNANFCLLAAGHTPSLCKCACTRTVRRGVPVTVTSPAPQPKSLSHRTLSGLTSRAALPSPGMRGTPFIRPAGRPVAVAFHPSYYTRPPPPTPPTRTTRICAGAATAHPRAEPHPDDDMFTPTGYPSPPPHSNRHGPQHTQPALRPHRATPSQPPADAPTPLKRSMLTRFGGPRPRSRNPHTGYPGGRRSFLNIVAHNPTRWIGIHVFLWRSHRSTNIVSRLVYPEYDLHTHVRIQGEFQVDALGVIIICRGCFECSCSKKKTCTHRYNRITLVS